MAMWREALHNLWLLRLMPQEMQNADKDGLKEAAEVLQRLIDGEIDIKELAKEMESLKHKEHKDDMAYI